MRPLIFVTLFFIVAHTAIGQDLKRVKLSRVERDKGIIAKYLGYGKGYHGSRFQLILKDHLDKDNVAITLMYADDGKLHREFVRIIPVLQSNAGMYTYIPLPRTSYGIAGAFLKEQE